MQDQPTDSSDLTTDDDTAAVPEGKATRRHRMPRQKLRPAAAGDAEPGLEPEAETEEELEGSTLHASSESGVDSEPAAGEPESEPAEHVSDEAEPAEPTEVIMVAHRPAGRRLKVAALVAGVLFVAASAFAGATLQPYLVDRAEVQTKLDVARTAQAAITTLWTYTPEDMDKLGDRAAKYLGGDFAKDYKDYIARIVEANKQAQISNSTQVLGAAVESLTPTEATAIIYTNSVATSPVTKGIPSLRYLSYRLQLERRGGHWLITSMTAVTSLDPTPRL